MIIYGYIIVIIILLVWFHLIIKEEVDLRKIFKRSLRILNSNKKLIYNSILSLVQYNEEGKKDLTFIKSSIYNLSYALVWVIGYALLIPIILPLIIQNISKGFGAYILYTILIVGLLIGKLKAETQNVVIVLSSYVNKVINPLETKADTITINIEETKELQLNKRHKIILVITIIFAISTSLVKSILLDVMNGNIVHRNISVAIVTVFLVYKYIKKIKSRKNIPKKGIIFESEDYYIIEKSIKNMCKKLKIEHLKCGVLRLGGINASSHINKEGVPEINVTSGLISILTDSYYKNEIKDVSSIFEVVVAHELAHIVYKDLKKIKIRLSVCSLLWFANLAIIMVSTILFKYSHLFMGLSLVLILLEMIFGKVMCDIRYWEQIAELKADRLAVSLCDGGKDAFAEYCGLRYVVKTEDEKVMLLEKTNKLNRFYKKYIKNEPHPLLERRLELIKNRNKWSWWEYFDHALVIQRWRISKRGWNGYY